MRSKPSRWANNPWLVFGTAVVEGGSALLVEIAGTRALSPFFGTSIHVWTAQITMTLLFLALGYAVGGWLSRRWRPWYLPLLFGTAGLWLCLAPLLRAPLLESLAAALGVAGGAFLAASVLFGLPLFCFGAISPVLIQHWDHRRPGAGGAAGLVYFVNTMGGLAAAWLTTLVLLPRLPLAIILGGCGLLLITVGLVWIILFGLRLRTLALVILLAGLALLGLAPTPVTSGYVGEAKATLLLNQPTPLGLVQVVDIPANFSRTLLIDGITQGGIDTRSGHSSVAFSEFLNVAAFRYHPGAHRALLLGLGSGALARQLAARGLEVTVIELEPVIVKAAREYFGLPDAVKVVLGDGRTALATVGADFDLVFLDAFAGENVPWHLFTREGLTAIRAKLATDGRLLVNLVTKVGGSPGLARVESGLVALFPEVRVHVQPQSTSPAGLVSATLVAGQGLQMSQAIFPGQVMPEFEPKIVALLGNGRVGLATTPVTTDTWSDLDYADADLRLEWRKQAVSSGDARALTF